MHLWSSANGLWSIILSEEGTYLLIDRSPGCTDPYWGDTYEVEDMRDHVLIPKYVREAMSIHCPPMEEIA